MVTFLKKCRKIGINEIKKNYKDKIRILELILDFPLKNKFISFQIT